LTAKRTDSEGAGFARAELAATSCHGGGAARGEVKQPADRTTEAVRDRLAARRRVGVAALTTGPGEPWTTGVGRKMNDGDKSGDLSSEQRRVFLEAAVEAARLAGRILLDWSARFTASEKSPADFVTEADYESQRAIYEFLHERFPEHRFLGEEDLPTVSAADSPFRWVVDPLDGTSNYVHGFPYYAVSIALEHRGRLQVGVVYDPTRDELFCASRGQGAFLNERRLCAAGAGDLSRALVIASLPVRVDRHHPAVADFLRVLERAQHLQRTGSAALNLAYVAAGRVDAYWSKSLNPWDMAAGVLLIQEAGGRATRCDGSPVDLAQPDVLGTNGSALHEQLLELLSGDASA